jgi:hypothetical protein
MNDIHFHGPLATMLTGLDFNRGDPQSRNAVLYTVVYYLNTHASEDRGMELLVMALMSLPEMPKAPSVLHTVGDEQDPNVGLNVTCDEVSVTLTHHDGTATILPYGIIYASEVGRLAPPDFHGHWEEIADDIRLLFAPEYRELCFDDRYETLRLAGKSSEEAASIAEDSCVTTEDLFAIVAAR